MKFIRWILGALILLIDSLFPPRSIQRSVERQSQIDQETEKLTLYEFKTCPFCVRVRRAAKRMGLKIPVKDAKKSTIGIELAQGGGKIQVPCLRIEDPTMQNVRWLYESADIVEYFKTRKWDLA
ncbi:MAG: glutaredoxin domain-containing protein [Bdellovibrionota bacterium]